MRFLKWLVLLLIIVLLTLTGWVTYKLKQYPSLQPYQQYFAKTSSKTYRQGEHVTATFLGTTSILISDGKTSILTDGFFTRPQLTELVFSKIAPDKEKIKIALQKAGIQRLAAVIPIHSHHDHAMDAPEVAKLTGAMLLGSTSTANIGRGAGLPESQIQVAEPGVALRFGDFTVTLLESKHLAVASVMAKLTGIGETIETHLATPCHFTQYKEGKSYSVFIAHPLGNTLIHGSAGYLKDSLQGLQADTIFLGIAGVSSLSEREQSMYLRETVETVGAKRIIPIHWDDFMQGYEQGLQAPPSLLAKFDKDMQFILQQGKKPKQRNVTLLDMWDKLVLYTKENKTKDVP